MTVSKNGTAASGRIDVKGRLVGLLSTALEKPQRRPRFGNAIDQALLHGLKDREADQELQRRRNPSGE